MEYLWIMLMLGGPLLQDHSNTYEYFGGEKTLTQHVS